MRTSVLTLGCTMLASCLVACGGEPPAPEAPVEPVAAEAPAPEPAAPAEAPAPVPSEPMPREKSVVLTPEEIEAMAEAMGNTDVEET